MTDQKEKTSTHTPKPPVSKIAYDDAGSLRMLVWLAGGLVAIVVAAVLLTQR